MNIAKNNYLKISLSILVSLGGLYAESLFATEWVNGSEEKNGFSEFSPPAPFNHKNKKDKYEWRSGSSFKSFNKERYDNSRVSRNPWKPVSKFSKTQGFSGQRPWGNVPQRKRNKVNNMRFHDQRFKKWVGRGDSLQGNNSYMNEPNLRYGRPSSNFVDEQLMYPGAHSRAYVPGGYVPFVANSPVLYGGYPGAFSSYSGGMNRPWNW